MRDEGSGARSEEREGRKPCHHCFPSLKGVERGCKNCIAS